MPALSATPDAECLPELTCHAATEAFLLENGTARTSEWTWIGLGGNATVAAFVRNPAKRLPIHQGDLRFNIHVESTHA